MPKRTHAARPARSRQQRSPARKHERKQRVLTQGTPSIVRSIADAVVVKDGDVFFLCQRDGDVPLEGEHGFGLYYHDCRFLSGYELRLADTLPSPLVASAARGFMAVLELTNPDLRMPDRSLLPKESVGIKWERLIDADHLALDDLFTLQNFGPQPIDLPLALTFRAGFEDVFEVRGLLPEKPGRLHPPALEEGALHFLYEGSDGLWRRVEIAFSPPPHEIEGTTARFHLTLQPREAKQLVVSIELTESEERKAVEVNVHHRPDPGHVTTLLHRLGDEWLGRHTQVQSDSLLLDSILDRSLRDLRVLRSQLGSEAFFAAGVPWFVTLFGRDSLITALQTLAYDPEIAEQTLRLLARYQGQKVDDWRDEEPGKVLHELRVGELARCGEIPHTPYYGTIDATPLFLVLIGRHAAWTGNLGLFHDLRDSIERALAWMGEYGDRDRDGYLEYASSSEKGLINQGWKDSGNAILNADGSLARPPIALVEVQGYVYMAKQGLAELYERAGDPRQANRLRQEADELRARFNRDFWLKDKGFYALALQAGKEPAVVLSSNPGHALWAGIADPDKAARTAERLMSEEMFSGWGVRTLSKNESGYNPIGYHLGTVWPHDNALIAAGFRRYGLDEAACRIFTGIAETAMHFDAYRLPELFAGFARAEYGVPVRYPVACHPQAWAAGAVPYLLETLLGLVPEAFDRRLRVVRPVLPEFVDRLEVRRLRVGRGCADLRFERTSTGPVATKILKVDGPLDVVVEPAAPASQR